MKRDPRTPWNTLAQCCTAAIALALSSFLATTSHAYLDAGGKTGIDTHYTPQAKDPPSGLVTQEAGARYSGPTADPSKMVPGSVTSIDTDLYAVSFRGSERGFAGGIDKEDGTTVPTVYSYTKSEGWRRDHTFPSSGRGFIADIAWIDEDRALAVGGDGAYPKREDDQGGSTCADGNEPQDPAGDARAWLYERGKGWRELHRGDGDRELPEGMRALMAVDFYIPDPAKPVQFGLAGGLCQIWHWAGGGFLTGEDGEFLPPYSAQSEGSQNLPELVFRVRSVSFARLPATSPPLPASERRPSAYVSTAGCCFADPAKSQIAEPVVFEWEADNFDDPSERGRWHVRDGYPLVERGPAYPNDTFAKEAFLRPRLRMVSADSYISVTATRALDTTNSKQPVHLKRPGLVATTLGPGTQAGGGSVEPPSVVGPGATVSTTREHSATAPIGTAITSARLLDAHGDVGGGTHAAVTGDREDPHNGRQRSTDLVVPLEPSIIRSEIYAERTQPGWTPGHERTTVAVGGRSRTPPDGVPDWAVGEASETAQGLVFSTDPGQLPAHHMTEPVPRFENCFGLGDLPGDTVSGERVARTERKVSCQMENSSRYSGTVADQPPTDPTRDQGRYQSALRSTQLLRLPTYALQAVNMVDEEAVGWAVGRHGAIVKITPNRGDARRGGEPKAPKLGSPKQKEVPDAQMWGAVPGQGSPGPIPALKDRSRVQLPEPKFELTDVHTKRPVKWIVMSRDGSEGWAIANSSRPMDMLHYDGSSWNECGDLDFDAVDGACESIRELQREGIIARMPTRVPNENDTDPSNDDEFEIAALGGSTGLVRYRSGRWQNETVAALTEIGGGFPARGAGKPISAAFVSPSDGWIFGKRRNDNSDRDPYHFYRYDGKSWRACVEGTSVNTTDTCDPAKVLPQTIPRAVSTEPRGTINQVIAAGDRIYAVGERREGACVAGVTFGLVPCTSSQKSLPFISYRERGPCQNGGDPGCWRTHPHPGTYDTFKASGVSGEQGNVQTIAVARRQDGHYEGWAVVRGRGVPLLRLHPGQGWRPAPDTGLIQGSDVTTIPDSFAISPDGSAVSPSFSVPSFGNDHPIARLDTRRMRWQPLEQDIEPPPATHMNWRSTAPTRAIASDGNGGVWAAVGHAFHHYTRTPKRPVFKEVAQPSHRLADRRLTALAAAADGTLWATTDSAEVHRYDRKTGWSSALVEGSDPGRVVTAPSPFIAVALTEDGSGIAVGRAGRIAQVGPQGVVLDPAAGTVCRENPRPPCGTGQDLRAAAVSSDGAAVAAGRGRALLWRAPGSNFQRISGPPAAPNTTFVGAAMTSAHSVWLATGSGEIWSGGTTGSRWEWRREHSGPILAALALDRDGAGYAVGPDGLILERRDGKWRRLEAPVDVDLLSIAIPAAGSAHESALIGGENGGILTLRDDRFAVARPVDHPTSASGDVIAVAAAPGTEDREIEAWAATDSPPRAGISRLLRYVPESSAALQAPWERAAALPDSPAPREGEFSLAAFGKSDCLMEPEFHERCIPITGTLEYTDVMLRRIVSDIADRSAKPGGPDLAVFTGDAVDAGGHPLNQTTADAAGDLLADFAAPFVFGAGGGPRKFRRWGELVADRLVDRGVPLLGAIGGQDLSENRACAYVSATVECFSAKERRASVPLPVTPGENLAWRQASALRTAPWGKATFDGSSPYRLTRVDQRGLSVRSPEVPTACGQTIREALGEARCPELHTTGADTHYAVDASDSAGRRVARIVVVDSSFGSVSGSDPVQRPVEGDGGQAAFVRRMLCLQGQPSPTGRCTRRPGQLAIVVSNAPTYSPGPGAGTHTATDGAAFETLLMEGRANLVISGRIGWNGIYWATAPGIHSPCPGEPQRTEPPSSGVDLCGQAPESAETDPDALAGELASTVASTAPAVAGGGAAPAIADQVLPFVVASGAGGKFATGSPRGDAREGFWHGYTIVRLDPTGDPAKTIVEQRPIYDWVGLEAQERVLRPGQRMSLRGFARGPIGLRYMKVAGSRYPPFTRHDRIEGPAVTHRYDLLAADSEKPWLPREGPDGAYVSLDPAIAVVDRQSGDLRVGRGNNPRTHAVAMLSVGDKAATYPLIFEPRRTFQPKGVLSQARSAAVVVQSVLAGVAPPGSPTAPPQVGSISPPVLPQFPGVQPPPAAPPLAQPQPTPPPPPPPAPTAPAALELAAAPPGLTVAPPAAVIPPPAPPINPAPPGGARKEARQRQAATEKSGSGSGEDSGMEGLQGDMAQDRPSVDGSAMTRRDREKASPSFTALSSSNQPSAWARTTLYGGGLTLAALALAAGWAGARPGPRRKPPVAPAPAYVRSKRRL